MKKIENRSIIGDSQLTEREATADRDSGSSERFLKLAEVYGTLQGEGSHSGLPCFFLRLAVCDIRCSWCDTPDSWTGGAWKSRAEILAMIPDNMQLVQITGGEPVLQMKRLRLLMEDLHERGKKILLETGGHRNLSEVPEFVHIIMDIKLPSSGEDGHPFEDNFPYLKATDEIKFVVQDERDFRAAVDWIERHNLDRRFQLLVSPVPGLDLKKLAAWVLETKLTMRLQVQLHKYIWGPDAKMV